VSDNLTTEDVEAIVHRILEDRLRGIADRLDDYIDAPTLKGYPTLPPDAQP